MTFVRWGPSIRTRNYLCKSFGFIGIGKRVQFSSLCSLFIYVSRFSDGQEVAVVYFRNGYMPQNYKSEQVFYDYYFLVLVVYDVYVKVEKHSPSRV